jgi:hypothetical protein
MGISVRVMQKWLSLLEVAELCKKWQSYAEVAENARSGRVIPKGLGWA